jgi:hypothetical protein
METTKMKTKYVVVVAGGLGVPAQSPVTEADSVKA